MAQRWPDIPLQPAGSEDCSFYAASYLGTLLGHYRSPEEVRRWRDTTNREVALFARDVLGAEPAWFRRNLSLEGYRIGYAHQPAFRKWCEAYLDHGCVAYATIFLVERMSHAVVLLEADDTGVLVADPVRGIVRDPWPLFESHVGDPERRPSHVEAFYSLPK